MPSTPTKHQTTSALVEERDHQCVFPYCTNRGRFDLDHIDPYLDPDDGGPPDQTSNQNLATLCRYHHRVKTFAGWTYRRIRHPWDLDPTGPDDDWCTRLGPPDHRQLTSATDQGGPVPAYRWTSPIGFAYLVDGTGTHALD